jgi:hypothetical protein
MSSASDTLPAPNYTPPPPKAAPNCGISSSVPGAGVTDPARNNRSAASRANWVAVAAPDGERCLLPKQLLARDRLVQQRLAVPGVA